MRELDTINVDPFYVQAIQPYKSKKKGQLSFKMDQRIYVTRSNVKEFMFFGELEGKTGWFPYFYVKTLRDSKLQGGEAPGPVTPRAKPTKTPKDTIIKTGMLHKRVGEQANNKGTVFQKRWFILRTTKLCYYRSAMDLKKSMGSVYIKQIKSPPKVYPLPSMNMYYFTIITKKGQVAYYSHTKGECEEWVRMINLVRGGNIDQGVTKGMLFGSANKDPRRTQNTPKRPNARAALLKQDTLTKIGKHLQEKQLSSGGITRLVRSQQPSAILRPYNADEIVFDPVVIPGNDGIGIVRAKYDYIGKSESELTFHQCDEILLVNKENEENGWWYGSLDHREGYIPMAFVEVIETFLKTATEQQRVPTERTITAVEDYQIGERIGKGQYGSVFRGLNTNTGEIVAIKQIATKMKKSELASIMGELDLLKMLDHENILSYKGFIKTDDHIHIILDLVEGGSLQSIIAKFGVIPEKLAVCYIKQILDGLDYLHGRGVVHRDIKSDNILVTKEGTAKVADFGISTKLGDAADGAAGSPYWMAPEVIQQISAGPSCDIWALGCTIIELLCGSPPYFEQNQMQALFSMVENDRPPFPPNISADMFDFLVQCFIREPKDRAIASALRLHPLVATEEERASAASQNLMEALDCLDIDESELAALGFDGADDADLAAALGALGDYAFDGIDTMPSTGDFSSDFDLLSLDVGDIDGTSSSLTMTPRDDDSDFEMLEQEDEDEDEDDIMAVVERMLEQFHDAMENGNVTHAISYRKHIRSKIPLLDEQKQIDDRYAILLEEIYAALDRCVDEMGEFIPVDSDDDL